MEAGVEENHVDLPTSFRSFGQRQIQRRILRLLALPGMERGVGDCAQVSRGAGQG